MPKRQQHWTGRCEFPLTDVYERGHAATFGAKADRYCKACGRLPSYCECATFVFAPGRYIIVEGLKP
jgi:hypothetical protein